MRLLFFFQLLALYQCSDSIEQNSTVSNSRYTHIDSLLRINDSFLKAVQNASQPASPLKAVGTDSTEAESKVEESDDDDNLTVVVDSDEEIFNEPDAAGTEEITEGHLEPEANLGPDARLVPDPRLLSGAHIPLFPRRVGIKNHAFNCYANSLLSSLYNLPNVQMSIFEEIRTKSDLRKESSVPMALAVIFNKMRTGRSFVDLEPFFAPAIQKSFQWSFGSYECVIEFWNRLSSGLPENISSLFQVEMQENHFTKSENVLIKSRTEKSNCIFVSPSAQYSSIEQLLAANFVDEEADDFIINPADQGQYGHVLKGETIVENVPIPSRTTLKILNCPEVLIFGVKRVRWNKNTQKPELDSTPLGFPEKLTINGEEYTISGNIEYDHQRVHYYAHNHDILDDQWYLHNDKFVHKIPDTSRAIATLSNSVMQKSCMVFYLKTSIFNEYANGKSVEVPAEVLEKLSKRSTKRKFDSEHVNTIAKESAGNPETESKRVRVKSAKLKDSGIIKASEKKKIQGSNANPSTSSSSSSATSSAIFDYDCVLGSIQFSYNPLHRNSVLESILIAYASHPAVVKKLFEEVQTMPSTSFPFKFVMVILKMLLGHKNISILDLTVYLVQNCEDFNFANVGKSWIDIAKLLPSGISPVPYIKVITYLFDEPCNISNHPACESVPLKPRKIVECDGDLQFEGVAFDQKETESGEIYNRFIMKSRGLILPLQIERFPSQNTFDNSAIQVNQGDFLSFSLIGFDPNTHGIFSIHLHPKGKLLFYENGQVRFEDKTEENMARVTADFKFKSLLILFSRKTDFPANLMMPKFSEIPKALLDQLQTDLFN